MFEGFEQNLGGFGDQGLGQSASYETKVSRRREKHQSMFAEDEEEDFDQNENSGLMDAEHGGSDIKRRH